MVKEMKSIDEHRKSLEDLCQISNMLVKNYAKSSKGDRVEESLSRELFAPIDINKVLME